MPVRAWTASAVPLLMTLLAATAPAQDVKPADVVSFDRDIQPIFRKRCGTCHNAGRPRGELDLTSYAAAMSGGASGKAVVADSPEESPAYTYAAHLETPQMPPNAPKIPQRELDLIRRWIEGGLTEKPAGAASASKVAAASPSGGLVKARTIPRPVAVTALAVSPVAPIAAVSGRKQVLLFDLAAGKLLGALPFPEGDVFALRFARDGATLLAAGGAGAESGKVALFDAKSWARTATVGDELDVVLAADLSPDGARVVLGGPGRVVKVLPRAGGEAVHNLRKPTDWVTAAGFGPDGLLVAAGDRFGGLFLWEARSGREFLALRGHTKAINALAWQAGGDRLVTAGEDGSIRLWDLHTGRAAASWDAHAGGVLGLDVDASGRIASAGRDRRVKVWDLGGKPVADLGPAADQVARVAWGPGGSLVSGDCAGEVRVWSLSSAASSTLPMPVAPRPAAVALVAPVLAPALRPAVKVKAQADPAGSGDDVADALASAREAAAAAERSVERLARLAGSRRPPSAPSAPAGRGEARAAAGSALDSLRAALAADPENPALRRAVEATQDALKLLDRAAPAEARASEGGR